MRHKNDAGYFDKLVSKFNGTIKTIYNFKYIGVSQNPDVFVVTLIPNKAGYTSLDQFKKNFDLCEVGGDVYLTMITGKWLILVNSCGSDASEGSGDRSGAKKSKMRFYPL